MQEQQNCSRKTWHFGIEIVSNGSSKVRFVSLLRILTGKKTPKWNSSASEQYEYEHLGCWYIKSTLYKRFLNWNKIFKKIKRLLAKLHSLWYVHFVLPIPFVLILASDGAVLYHNITFSILALLTIKCFRYLENLFYRYWKSSKFSAIVT